MDRPTDDALRLKNPRLLAAAYFGLLAVIATILVDGSLYLTGIDQAIPIFKAVVLAAVVASLFGLLFGRLIAQCPRPYRKKVFWLGFLMVLLALPVYDLGFLYLIVDYQSYSAANPPPNFDHLLVVYLFILFYSFIMLGLWLAIIAGFAALFLRGFLVYSILHSEKTERDPLFQGKKSSALEKRSNHGEHLPH